MSDVITYEELVSWSQMSSDLAVLKKKEAEVRRDICECIFGNDLTARAHKFEMNNVKVVATNKITRSLDKEAFSAIHEELTEAELAAIKYTPSLVAAVYKTLPDDCILQEAITEKPAMPTLKVSTL